MTITGNNKDNTGDFNKDITVKVSPQVGELKNRSSSVWNKS